MFGQENCLVVERGGTGGDHSERGDIRARHLLIFHTFYTIVTSFLYFTLLTLEATFLLDEWIYKNWNRVISGSASYSYFTTNHKWFSKWMKTKTEFVFLHKLDSFHFTSGHWCGVYQSCKMSIFYTKQNRQTKFYPKKMCKSRPFWHKIEHN